MFNDSFSDINDYNEIFGANIFNEVNFCEDCFDKNTIKQNNFIESSFDFVSPKLKGENIFGEKQKIQNENSFFNNPKTLNVITIDEEKNELGKKRNKTCVRGKTHDKFTDDNLRRKIKHLVLKSSFNFINKKIKEIYKNNIGKGIFELQLLKINKKQKSEAKIAHDKELLKKSLGDIFSVNITRKYRNYPLNQNTKIIDILKNDEKFGNPEYFRNLFNLSFLKCLKHYRGDENILELEGLEGIEIIKDKFKEDKDYIKNLEYYIMNFETIINNKKGREFKKKENK